MDISFQQKQAVCKSVPWFLKYEAKRKVIIFFGTLCSTDCCIAKLGPYVMRFICRDSLKVVHFKCRDSPNVVHFKCRECPYIVYFKRRYVQSFRAGPLQLPPLSVS